MAQVQILSRQPGKRADEAGVERDVLAVTYSSAEVPPRTVFVEGESPTEEAVQAAIRQDLDARAAERPHVLDV